MDRWNYVTPPQDFFAPPDDGFFDTRYERISHEHEPLPVEVRIKVEPAEVKPEPETPFKAKPETPFKRRRSMSVSAVMQTTTAFRQPKQPISSVSAGVSTLSLHDQQPPRYVTMAEAIYRLQKSTPERFHTLSKNQKDNLFRDVVRQKRIESQVTIPHSPMLLSKSRHRPTTAPSREQLEQIELDEMKKHRIKARPVPATALYGIANLAPVRPRPTTKPEPFNLTEIKPKPVELDEPKKTFTARPVPKFKPHSNVQKSHVPVTVPVTPKITKVKARSLDLIPKSMERSKVNEMMRNMKVGHTGVPVDFGRNRMEPCRPTPFSFDERDRAREERRREMIRKVLDEERRLREFHAKPIPRNVLRKQKSNESTHSSASSSKENKENQRKPFRARPPAVLHREPFVPVHAGHALLEPQQVQLATEQRAREREAFQQKIKEKEDRFETMRLKKEALDRENEERLKATLRAQTVHRAAPVRHYQPVVVHPSSVPLTLPKSPNFNHA